MKSRLATYMNLGGRILVSTLLAVVVTAAAGAQSAPVVSSTEARQAIQAAYAEYAKARAAVDVNAIEKLLAPDFCQTFTPYTVIGCEVPVPRISVM